MKALSINAWIILGVFALSCGERERSADPLEQTDMASDTAAVGDRVECDAYLACLLTASPPEYAGALTLYGEEAACWDTAEQAVSCEQVCEGLLADLIDMGALCQVPDQMNSDSADMGTPSDTGDRFVFPGEQVACKENASFAEQSAILSGGKNNPTGRGEQGGVFDPCNQRVIVFGGNDRQPEECASFGAKNYLGDTWAYAMEYENWYRINSDSAPAARGRHAFAFDLSRKRMMVFGGRFRPAGQGSGDYTLFNDLWAFDVNTDTWTQIAATGNIPSPRINSAMIYDESADRLILFGGSTSANGLVFTPMSDLYLFDLNNAVWTQVSLGGPEARLFHAMVVDSTHEQLLVFSGGDENAFLGPFLQDLWAFSFQSSTWEKIWQGVEGGPGPLARINARLLDDPMRSRVLLFGGHDDKSLGNSNDLWAFDSGLRQWTTLRAGDVYTGQGCSSFCQCPLNFVTYDQDSPERRQYHTFSRVGSNEALLFGGSGDCGYMDDTWALDLETDTWREVHAAEQGIACARTGRANCEELCF